MAHDCPQCAEVTHASAEVDSDDAFDIPSPREYSCYSGIVGTHQHLEKLHKIPRGEMHADPHHPRVMPLAQVAHDQLRAHILGDFYPCLGARVAFHHGTYRFGFYKTLGHRDSAEAHARDLRRFVEEHNEMGEFATFVAVFKYPQITTEARFEKLLWRHLQGLHRRDGDTWDPHYDPDPQSPHFAFSFGGCAFFIVGMHAGASRYSRRFAFPAIVMNPESQILSLKAHGIFDRFAHDVRKRDARYQGSLNPSVPTEAAAEESEARVYSGRPHPPGSSWECPFHPRPTVAEGHVRVSPNLPDNSKSGKEGQP